jgi:hypothetical protein
MLTGNLRDRRSISLLGFIIDGPGGQEQDLGEQGLPFKWPTETRPDLLIVRQKVR